MEDNFLPKPKHIHQHCPLCGHVFKDNDLDILEADESQMMVYSTCGRCGVGMVAKLSVMPQGLFGLGILTDLNKEEVQNFQNHLPVSAQQVLEMKLITDRGKLEIRI